ncbi:hypothetical protein [Thalassobacillus sp. C254]|nr:hypothetical protein [Thalassobacillus sp. C254]
MMYGSLVMDNANNHNKDYNTEIHNYRRKGKTDTNFSDILEVQKTL